MKALEPQWFWGFCFVLEKENSGDIRHDYDTKKKTRCVYDTDTTAGGQLIFLSSRYFL